MLYSFSHKTQKIDFQFFLAICNYMLNVILHFPIFFNFNWIAPYLIVTIQSELISLCIITLNFKMFHSLSTNNKVKLNSNKLKLFQTVLVWLFWSFIHFYLKVKRNEEKYGKQKHNFEETYKILGKMLIFLFQQKGFCQ